MQRRSGSACVILLRKVAPSNWRPRSSGDSRPEDRLERRTGRDAAVPTFEGECAAADAGGELDVRARQVSVEAEARNRGRDVVERDLLDAHGLAKELSKHAR